MQDSNYIIEVISSVRCQVCIVIAMAHLRSGPVMLIDRCYIAGA